MTAMFPLAALSLALASGAPGAADGTAPLEALEAAGRRLYEEGTRADGTEVLARVGRDPAPVPASVLPCASCHGPDGRGRPEGAVVPPSLRWRELTKAYGHVDGRRTHPPFDARTFARAVQEGVDPAGNPLDDAMPRYSLSRADLEALVAWLRRLESRLDPGLGERVVRLGTVLPAGGPAREAGLAMRGVLEAVVREVNEAGGVNGRRLELVVAEAGEGPEGAAAAVASLAGPDGVFALVSGLAPRAEAALAEAAERAGLPLVGPFSRPVAAAAPSAFYLSGGAVEQVRLLVDYAAREAGLAGGALLVLRPEGADGAALAAEASAQARRRGLAPLVEVTLRPGDLGEAEVAALAARGATAVLHLGAPDALVGLLRGAAAAGWAPIVLAPGALAGRAAADAAVGFSGRLLLAYPTAPADETPAGRARLDRLAGDAGRGRHRQLQASAAGAMAVTVEALRRAGRDLDRRRLVESLEGLQGFETGWLPPISFGPGRRVGALGGYLVAADGRSLRAVAGWRRLE